jgi:hypothetical protein
MDWSNESYVRLYVRDTTSWKRLGWDGQCVLMQLLRKVDRAGTMDLDGIEPWEAVMLHTGAPLETAQRGVEALLRVGVIELRAGMIVFPNFLDAQECSKSDKLRAKESRERKARGSSQNVTLESRDVTKPSQVVTSGHEPSQRVTLCSAVLCNTGEERASAPPLLKVAADLEAENAQTRPTLVSTSEPTRFITALSDGIATEYERRKKPRPAVFGSQLREISKRIHDSLAAKLFDSADEAIEALVKAAADAVEKDPKARFAFVLGEVPFTKPRAEDEPEWLKARRLIPRNF